MDELLNRLEEVLRAEGNTYAGFCTRLPLKVELIKRNQVVQLERIVQQEEAHVQALSKFERERQSILSEVSRRLSLHEGTLDELLRRLDPAWRDRLAPLGQRLKTLAKKLHDGNWYCDQLLNAAVEYIDYSMNLIARTFSTNTTTYGEPETNETPSLILDWIA